MTHQQHRLLDFIRVRLNAYGVAPSFDEMRAHLGLQSKSGVHRLLQALEERGKIARRPAHARAIGVIGEQVIPVDAATYRYALAKANAAGMSLPQFTAIALNSMETRR